MYIKGQGSQSTCNSISTDCNRNWTEEKEEGYGDDVDPPLSSHGSHRKYRDKIWSTICIELKKKGTYIN